MIPAVCIVGKHNAGKTTLLERLIPLLQARGRRVGVIKHAAHGFELDRAGSDSWRLAQTGAAAVVLGGPDSAVLRCGLAEGASLPQLLGLLPNLGFDLVLVEGFKQSALPKIEVHRAALGHDLMLDADALEAVVSDDPNVGNVTRFATTDVQGLATFLIERFPPPAAEDDSIRLTIDGEEIPVNAFASAVLSGGILGMLSALKGVSDPRDIRILLRRGGTDSSR